MGLAGSVQQLPPLPAVPPSGWHTARAAEHWPRGCRDGQAVDIKMEPFGPAWGRSIAAFRRQQQSKGGARRLGACLAGGSLSHFQARKALLAMHISHSYRQGPGGTPGRQPAPEPGQLAIQWIRRHSCVCSSASAAARLGAAELPAAAALARRLASCTAVGIASRLSWMSCTRKPPRSSTAASSSGSGCGCPIRLSCVSTGCN